VNRVTYFSICASAGFLLYILEMVRRRKLREEYSILWLFAWGDAGQARAARSGDVTIITHMDREMQVILFGLYSRVTTIVYGD